MSHDAALSGQQGQGFEFDFRTLDTYLCSVPVVRDLASETNDTLENGPLMHNMNAKKADVRNSTSRCGGSEQCKDNTQTGAHVKDKKAVGELVCLQCLHGGELLSAKRERAHRRKRQRLRPNPNRNEQERNDKMRCSGHPHLERRVEGFGPVAFPVLPSSGGATPTLIYPCSLFYPIAYDHSSIATSSSLTHLAYVRAPLWPPNTLYHRA
ncbi:hypothetical protein PIB30_039077 [Stylosanthes scabra]|uniref:Uncharacterized protein n=1 Tax=Stylosanthes scabra TaxID=79078 RepID=A0ABU6WCJ8_9FABA|nr:hypothetical protein [Stylosanthes scabra]